MLHLLTARTVIATVAALAVAAASSAVTAAQADPNAAGLRDFRARCADYVKLRAALAGRLEPLSPTPSAADLAARRAALAAALQKTRSTARHGDLIPAPAAELIRSAVAEDLKRRTPAEKRATLEEVPERVPVVINRVYPSQGALPTLPPLLLNTLPSLPDNLQYRFYDRHIIILDGDTEIILDYVANVLPPH